MLYASWVLWHYYKRDKISAGDRRRSMGTYTVHVMRNGKVRDITGEAGESLMNAFIRNDIYI